MSFIFIEIIDDKTIFVYSSNSKVKIVSGIYNDNKLKELLNKTAIGNIFISLGTNTSVYQMTQKVKQKKLRLLAAESSIKEFLIKDKSNYEIVISKDYKSFSWVSWVDKECLKKVMKRFSFLGKSIVGIIPSSLFYNLVLDIDFNSSNKSFLINKNVFIFDKNNGNTSISCVPINAFLKLDNKASPKVINDYEIIELLNNKNININLLRDLPNFLVKEKKDIGNIDSSLPITKWVTILTIIFSINLFVSFFDNHNIKNKISLEKSEQKSIYNEYFGGTTNPAAPYTQLKASILSNNKLINLDKQRLFNNEKVFVVKRNIKEVSALLYDLSISVYELRVSFDQTISFYISISSSDIEKKLRDKLEKRSIKYDIFKKDSKLKELIIK